MFEKARNWMNDNSSIATVGSVIILICALGFIVSRFRRGGGGGEPGDAYYYDTVTKEVFTDKTTKIAPFNRENGNEAVRVHYFTCGECTEQTKEEGGERFVGYYEKYTPEVRAKLSESSESFMIYEMAFQGRLYSADGKTWVAADKPKGIQITSKLQTKCPPKKLRYCPPG